MKTLLVGELNPLSADPRFDLFPLPARSSGNRLRNILGLQRVEYMRKYDRQNLCRLAWSAEHARDKATEILESGRERLVLLGYRVCRAFRLEFEPFQVLAIGKVRVATLPHPSGLCRVWNDPGSIARARETIVLLEAP